MTLNWFLFARVPDSPFVSVTPIRTLLVWLPKHWPLGWVSDCDILSWNTAVAPGGLLVNWPLKMVCNLGPISPHFLCKRRKFHLLRHLLYRETCHSGKMLNAGVKWPWLWRTFLLQDSDLTEIHGRLSKNKQTLALLSRVLVFHLS